MNSSLLTACSDSDDELWFQPAKLCPADISISPVRLPHEDNLNIRGNSDDGWNDSPSEREAGDIVKLKPPVSSTYPSTPFLLSAARISSHDLSENVSDFCGDAMEKVAETSNSQVNNAIPENIGFYEDGLVKLKDNLEKDIFQPWEPSSLIKGLGVNNGLGVKDCSHKVDPPLIQMCYFLANANAHLMIIRRELVQCRRELNNMYDIERSKDMGFKDKNNLCRFSFMLNSLCTNADELKRSSIDLLKLFEDSAQSNHLMKNGKILKFVNGIIFTVSLFGVGYWLTRKTL